MTKRFQFGWMAVALINVAAFGAVAGDAKMAQAPNRPPQRQQQAPAPRPPSQPAPRPNINQPNANRPPAGQTQRQAGGAAQHTPNTQRQPSNGSNRPPTTMAEPPRANNFNNRPHEGGPGTTLRPRQQVGVGAPRPFVDRMRDLNPQQRDRVLQSSRAFQNLAPEQQSRIRQQFNQWDRLNAQQRADLRVKEDTWRRMTPEQRSYVKNDVLPRWRQIPWERQQVIQQKLGVLQNMPESARNRRLSDPNFTRGMSDEDRQTLHDLSHLHVGGAPDPPGNE
jgi:Protein of unknown function (DUF3106)